MSAGRESLGYKLSSRRRDARRTFAQSGLYAPQSPRTSERHVFRECVCAANLVVKSCRPVLK
jgi:hypothetical protein